MTKKLLFICLLFLTTNCFTQDYWVYLAKVSKVDDILSAKQHAGRNNKGDVIEVLPITPQFIPTEREKIAFHIVKVTNAPAGLRRMLRREIKDSKDITITYRKYKIDLLVFGGIKEIAYNDFVPYIINKTTDTVFTVNP